MTDLKRLFDELKRRCGSIPRLAKRLGESERLVRMWAKKGDEELRRIHPDHIKAIQDCARSLGIEPELYDRPPDLWDHRKSFEENMGFDPGIPPEPATPYRNHRTPFLGFTLRSPLGASPSVLTATAARVRFLAQTGLDLITYKTVRTTAFRAHPHPNLFFGAPTIPSLDPQQPLPPIEVGDVDEGCSSRNGLLNRFGMPSPPPEVWQADFRAAKNSLLEGQLLILSVVATPANPPSERALIADLVRIVRLGIDAGADVVEINLSCPNCPGDSGLLYKDLALTQTICKALARVPHLPKVLLKIGYLERSSVRPFVLATAPYVDGYTAINTIAVEAVRRGQLGLEPAFFAPGLKAGLSGRPILRFALQTVKALAQVMAEERLDKKVVVGGGGISTPYDVKAFLESGANVIQITTALFADSLFGMRARKYLDAEMPAAATVGLQEREEAARIAWSRALEQLAEESPRDADLAHVGALEWMSWQREYREAARLGPRREMTANVDYFVARIRRRLP